MPALSHEELSALKASLSRLLADRSTLLDVRRAMDSREGYDAALWAELAAIGLLGLVITAALFLQMLQQLFFGELPAARSDFSDLDGRELGVLAVLLLLVVALGVYPAWLLRVIAAAPSVLAGTP